MPSVKQIGRIINSSFLGTLLIVICVTFYFCHIAVHHITIQYIISQYIICKSFYTSSMYGMDSEAPILDTVIEEALEAIFKASATLFPFVIAAIK